MFKSVQLWVLWIGIVFLTGGILPAQSKNFTPQKDSSTLKQGKEALHLAKGSGNHLDELEASIALAGTYIEFHLFDEAEALLAVVQPLAFATESSLHKAQWFQQNGRLRMEQNEHSLAEYFLLRSIDLYQSAKTSDSLGLPFLRLAINAQVRNEYDRATLYAIQALKVFEANQDSFHLAKTREELGYIYQDQLETERALGLFESNLAYYRTVKDTAGIASAYGNIAMCHYDLEQNPLALAELDTSLALFKTIGDAEGVSESYNNIALPYIELGQFDQALEYLDSSKALFEQINDTRQLSIMLYNIAAVKQEQGKIKEAQVLFEEAYALDKKHKIPFAGIDYHWNMHTIFAEKGDFETALDHFYTFTELRDSMFTDRKMRNIQELQFRYDSEKKEQELYEKSQEVKLLTRDKQLNRTRTFALVLLLLTVAVSLLFIIYRTRAKHKRNLLIAQKEEEITRFKLAAAQEKLAENNVKLEEFTKNLLEKNWLVSEMEEQIGRLKDLSKEEEADKARKLEELLNLKILTEEDWQQYKSLFTGVYPEFMPGIDQRFPFLTEGEKRFLMLLKLGVSSREMAAILGVSQGSIRVSRYRIRKKMKLEESQKLEEIIG